jgi:hypothetical protein
MEKPLPLCPKHMHLCTVGYTASLSSEDCVVCASGLEQRISAFKEYTQDLEAKGQALLSERDRFKVALRKAGECGHGMLQQEILELEDKVAKLRTALDRYHEVTGQWIFEGHGPNIHQLRAEIEEMLK